MESSGFTNMAASIALASLLTKKLIKQEEFQEGFNNESYTGNILTKKGWNWVLSNKDKFLLQKPKTEKAEDEIPF